MASVRERLDAVLAKLETRKSDERVFMKLYPETARQEADAADKRITAGEVIGPLDGRIVSIKDLFDVAGEPTLAGSVIRKTEPAATEDAVIVRRLREAGAVIIGKTHMTEFAFTPVGLNPHYPVLGNAVDPKLIPGGSSSGAAVSAVEGTSEIAIGSDTGGSVRIPAALNGLVGFKPTAQRIPLQGAFPLSPSLDSVGPLTKSVADCILADAVMAGDEPIIPSPASLQELRIAIPKNTITSDVDDVVAGGFKAAIQALEAAGGTIIEIEIDDLVAQMIDLMKIGSIVSIEASRIHAATWLLDKDANVDERVKEPLARRLKVPEDAYVAMLKRRNELAAEMDHRLKDVDFFLTPATPIVATTIASVEADKAEDDRIETLLLHYTQIANRFDLCSITLPIPNTKLPVGLMLTARNGSDKRLLAAALSVEKALMA